MVSIMQHYTEAPTHVLDLSIKKYIKEEGESDSAPKPYEVVTSENQSRSSESGSPTYVNSNCNYYGCDVSMYSQRPCSMYSTESKSHVNPSPSGSGQCSPNYASCYPEHSRYSPRSSQASVSSPGTSRQGVIDNMPEVASEGAHAVSLPMYPLAASGRDGKVTRPFKAYPKDPITLSAGMFPVNNKADEESMKKYEAYRKSMLETIYASNGGQHTVSNPKMRRTMNNKNSSTEDVSPTAEGSSDNSYSERRRKNNAAAKKSRDRRRIKEDEIAIRAAYLERENLELRMELENYKRQHAMCPGVIGHMARH